KNQITAEWHRETAGTTMKRWQPPKSGSTAGTLIVVQTISQVREKSPVMTAKPWTMRSVTWTQTGVSKHPASPNSGVAATTTVPQRLGLRTTWNILDLDRGTSTLR